MYMLAICRLLLRNVNNLPVIRDNPTNLRKLSPPLENHHHVFHQMKGFCVALPSEISTMKTIQFYFVWFPNSKLYLKYSFKFATLDSLEILSVLHVHLQAGQSWEHSPD